MTIRQAIRRKVTSALVFSAACIAVVLLIFYFFPQAPWAGVSVLFMFGAVAPLFYAVLLIDCPKCHVIFGQTHVFNVAFNLLTFNDGSICPSCGVNLDSESSGP